MVRLRWCGALAILASSIALAGCTSADSPQAAVNTPSASATPAGDDGALLLVVIGDSIPNNSSADCPDCTGFVDTVAANLRESSGGPVNVENRSRHDGAQTQDIADQLEDDKDLIGLLSDADIVIASFGFNDQPPYLTAPAGCPVITDSDSDETAFTAVVATTTPCVDAQTAILREKARGILARLQELAPQARIGVLNSYNAWTGWPRLEEDFAELVAPLTATIAYALDRWNEALCAEAAAATVTCVDLYHRFNGTDGKAAAATLLAEDYTHPSQEGNDAIADEVVASGLLTDAGS
jgi:lysophospholipase L1-like esterase